MTKEAKDRLRNKPHLIPAYQWHLYHDWPPPGGLRYLIFHAATNGFAKAFKRVGRRVLIDEKKFFECIEERNKIQKEGQREDDL